MDWADARAWDAVLRSECARTDPKILIWLYHIHTVQRAFVQVWRSEEPKFREPADFPYPADLCRWGREGHAEVRAFLSQAGPDSLAREIRLPWAGEIAEASRQLTHPTLGQTAMQVSMHSTHHRGQVNARLRDLGAEPPLTDYIAWIWLGRPDAQWPAASSAV